MVFFAFFLSVHSIDLITIFSETDFFPKVPTIAEWIASNLADGDRIGADPKLVGADVWLDWNNELGGFVCLCPSLLFKCSVNHSFPRVSSKSTN